MKTKLFTIFCLLSILLAGCDQITPTQNQTQTQNSNAFAMIAFRVTLPTPPNAGEAVMLTVVDEVTGLAFNPKNYPLQAQDALHYTVILPFQIGSVIRYHYTRQNGIVLQEHSSDGRPVRYRMYRVDGPGTVDDIVSRWTDTPFTWPSGRISGKVTDAETGRPVPNVLVTAGGAQTFSSSDGSYLLEGLPVGTHNLVAYALDGFYQTYQQGAAVAADSNTPATFSIYPTSLVNVTFTVSVPDNTPTNAPLRFAGNLIQLGNTYADLTGGESSIASRMPPLVRLPDGRYSITLTLPVGVDIQYKYTLGDGYWSCEHYQDGSFRLRDLIVPSSNVAIEEQVDSWQESNLEPIVFTVNVPETTSLSESVGIQFNPGYSWMEPIPMWPAGHDGWEFVLSSPLEGLASIEYRYCRESQCGSADDAQTIDIGSVITMTNRVVNPSIYGVVITDTVQAWAWTTPIPPATVPGVDIQPRAEGFAAGIEFQSGYQPDWGPLWEKAISDARQTGANWLVFTPSWTFTRLVPPVLELQPGQDILWAEQANIILTARDAGFDVALFPTPNFPTEASLWWEAAPRDFSWWISWFDHYRDFLLHFADLANFTGTQTLILGGDWLAPALPGGTMTDGTDSKVPADVADRWVDIINQVRARFDGTILWAIPYSQDFQKSVPFIDALDGIYFLWSVPLAKNGDAPQEASNILDTEILPYQQQIDKQIYLGLSYPSATGVLSGCISNADGACVTTTSLARPNPEMPGVQVNMQEQADAYNAMFVAINERSWISGVISRGYYPPVVLQDTSASIRGKLAAGVVGYWYQKFLGK